MSKFFFIIENKAIESPSSERFLMCAGNKGNRPPFGVVRMPRPSFCNHQTSPDKHFSRTNREEALTHCPKKKRPPTHGGPLSPNKPREEVLLINHYCQSRLLLSKPSHYATRFSADTFVGSLLGKTQSPRRETTGVGFLPLPYSTTSIPRQARCSKATQEKSRCPTQTFHSQNLLPPLPMPPYNNSLLPPQKSYPTGYKKE